MDMNLFQRLSAVSSEVGKIAKDATVTAGYGSYKAVTHDAVTGQTRAAMEKYGVIAITSVESFSETREELTKSNGDIRTVFRCTVEVCTEFINCDNPEETYQVKAFGTGEDGGDKAVGKAISYATKYSLLKGLMLETGDDTDHDASHEGTRHQPAPDKPWLNDITELVSVAIQNGWSSKQAIAEARKKYAVSRKTVTEIENTLGV